MDVIQKNFLGSGWCVKYNTGLFHNILNIELCYMNQTIPQNFNYPSPDSDVENVKLNTGMF